MLQQPEEDDGQPDEIDDHVEDPEHSLFPPVDPVPEALLFVVELPARGLETVDLPLCQVAREQPPDKEDEDNGVRDLDQLCLLLDVKREWLAPALLAMLNATQCMTCCS